MNLLLLEPQELGADGRATLCGRRAAHVHAVLKARAGDPLRIGVVDGPLGTARIVRSAPDQLELACELEAQPGPRPQDVLLLAVPRPRVLLRCLEDAAALGYGRIVLFRSWRVDKSHLLAQAMQPAVQREHLLLGLEQSRRTHLPEVLRFPLFKPFVEDVLVQVVTAQNRLVAHPEGGRPLTGLRWHAGLPATLALGPEGGFLPYELAQLEAHGFARLTLGPHPLRVSTALAAISGQLVLMQSPGARA